MVLIALCDDEEAELKKTEQMFAAYRDRRPEMEFTVKCFEDADELLYMVRENEYMPELVVLDIYMAEKTGIEAARELRDMGNTGKILFLTSSREHALDAFGVDAVQYLVKPVSEEILFPLLDRYLSEIMEEKRRYLLLRIQGRVQRVALNDIIYCEAQGKTQCMYLADGSQCMLRTTMAEVGERLSAYKEFVRVGVAYIVNLECVDSMNAQEICLNNGKKIHLPRGTYKVLKEQYFHYYCEEN
ncbi:MAG: LytTR family DNA-binding domain-containing protein [Roseburia sp.]|nr:LytTR family DNA-binding domain-containing protein [Roseburia sp.]